MTHAQPKGHLVVVLVRPQLPENIGFILRSIGNFSDEETRVDVRIVSPHPSLEDPKIKAVACLSADLIKDIRSFSSLPDALFDCTYVLATSALVRQHVKPIIPSYACFQEGLSQKIAVVFGPERTGLTTDEIALCHAMVQIPVHAKKSSMNVSHAVTVLLYEWYCAVHQLKPSSASSVLHTGSSFLATHNDTMVFLNHLEHYLDEIHFWRTQEKKPIMWRNIQNMFTRHHYTTQELKTLTGVLVLSKVKALHEKS